MFETHNSVTNFFRSLERFIGNFAFFCAFVSTGYMRTTRNFLCGKYVIMFSTKFMCRPFSPDCFITCNETSTVDREFVRA